MHKKLFAILAVFALLVLVNPALAAKPTFDADLPEEDGIYDVPGHQGLKLRVIVHKVKPTPALALVQQCNISDPDSTAVVDSAGWHLPASFTYRLNPNSVPSSVGSANLKTIAQNSFGVWTTAINNKVTLTQGANTTKTKQAFDGQNIITFGSASGSALGITYIWYNTSTKLVRELDTILNTKFSWAWSNPANWKTPTGTTCAYLNVYDAQNVLTHELGHWLGLDDEYDVLYANNTMYGYGFKGETKGDTLTQGDITGVQAIYK